MISPGNIVRVHHYGVALWENCDWDAYAKAQTGTWVMNIPSDARMLVLAVGRSVAYVFFTDDFGVETFGFVDTTMVEKVF